MRSLVKVLGLGVLLTIALTGCPQPDLDSGVTDAGQNTDGGNQNTDGGNQNTDGGNPATDSGNPPMDSGTTVECNPAFGPAAGACGGDPTGTWTYSEVCGSTGVMDVIGAFCATATLQAEETTGAGTVVVTATTYDRDFAGTATVQVDIPTSCVTGYGGCAGLVTYLTGQGYTAVCPDTGTYCDCAISGPISYVDNGTYTVAGNVITAVPAGGGAVDLDFCVDGDVFTYSPVGADDLVFVLTR